MIHTIVFEGLSCLLIDFVDDDDGLLYLRMVGEEVTVNAIWSRLVAREHREKKYSSMVRIPSSLTSHPSHVAAQKAKYKTLRKRLSSSSYIDLALIHPRLTVADDSNAGFYLLTYDDDLPTAFFERLNKTLSLPIKSEWASFLWEAGQQTHDFTIQVQKMVNRGDSVIPQHFIEYVTATPITELDSIGMAKCYHVKVNSKYREAWLHIVRQEMGLGITLNPSFSTDQQPQYLNGTWGAYQINEDAWELRKQDETTFSATSLHELLAKARHRKGLHFIIPTDTQEDQGRVQC